MLYKLLYTITEVLGIDDVESDLSGPVLAWLTKNEISTTDIYNLYIYYMYYMDVVDEDTSDMNLTELVEYYVYTEKHNIESNYLNYSVELDALSVMIDGDYTLQKFYKLLSSLERDLVKPIFEIYDIINPKFGSVEFFNSLDLDIDPDGNYYNQIRVEYRKADILLLVVNWIKYTINHR